MAALHGHGRVLPEWTFAHLGWLVRAAPAALVSCRDRVCHAGSGVGPGLYAFSAAALANRVLFHCDALAGWCHPDGELHLLELSGSRDGSAVARRSLCAGRHIGEVETQAHGWNLPSRKNAADTRTENLEGEQWSLLASAEAFCQRRYVDMDLLCDDGRTHPDVCQPTFAHLSGGSTGAVPHCQSLRTLRGDDAWTI